MMKPVMVKLVMKLGMEGDEGEMEKGQRGGKCRVFIWGNLALHSAFSRVGSPQRKEHRQPT